MPTPFAHSNGPDPASWQTLSAHSENVARLAGSFAELFGSSVWGELAGWLHDAGKSRAAFQHYLARSNGIDAEPDATDHDHSAAGAVWASQSLGPAGRVLAYCIAGHHAGLPDWSNGETPGGALSLRLAEGAEVLREPDVARWIAAHETDWRGRSLVPPWPLSGKDSTASFWTRMLFSCLVDADFLDTESFLEPARGSLRSSGLPLDVLARSFFAKLDAKQSSAPASPVNGIRAEIRAACERTAEEPPGIFSLTVPTGGGKTLSGTAFAFRHALRHGLRRIVYVIPYTSIIEQTADVLRGFLGAENVVEHHSNFDPDKETPRSRLASENWDAPVVVTTAVQFFESLHACRPGRCRKLHNIAGSVVVLDEVQLLPGRLLLPCAEAIRQLAAHYRTSIVLSTATQLALPGLSPSDVREIVPPDLDLYRRLKRVRIEFPADRAVRRDWNGLAEELRSFPQVLCIVNTRRDCRALFDRMPAGTFHLSASMCGEHRSRVIARIKSLLAEGAPVRVVSTQLVEAGVDVDFPVVFRAFAGLSSVVQSAGRCNREGRLGEPGRVVVFMPPEPSPVKDLRDGEYALDEMLGRPGGVNPDDPAVFPDYFRALHRRAHDLGVSFERTLGVPVPASFRNGAVASRPAPGQWQFREAAAAFQMIDDDSASVVVRYGESDALVAALRASGPTRSVLRRLQRYTVGIPRRRLSDLLSAGMVEELRVPSDPDRPSGIFLQTDPSAYDKVFGLDLFRDASASEAAPLRQTKGTR